MKAKQEYELVEGIIEPIEAWVKTLVAECQTVDAVTLEQRVRSEGIKHLANLFAGLGQAKLDQQEQGRRCSCGGRMHHAGEREREVMTSMGPIRLHGVYRRCRDCGHRHHPVDQISREWLSEPMQDLLTLLGVSMASFAKAESVCRQVLRVKVSDQTLRRQTEAAGRALPPKPPGDRPVAAGERLIGSCDGTSVNTREDGWRELKAYLFEHGEGKQRVTLSEATLERTERFCPRIREGAVAMNARDAGELFFVADAAPWIDEGLRVNLPDAVRIIDIFHAYEHVHAAAKGMFGEETDKTSPWADLWCEQLRLEGGREVWDRLRRTRHRYDPGSEARLALEQLLGYLDRHAEHLDYPQYIRKGWPISSGSMESTCKRLGSRMKGSGMRWKKQNVTPMSRLRCRFLDDQPLRAAA